MRRSHIYCQLLWKSLANERALLLSDRSLVFLRLLWLLVSTTVGTLPVITLVTLKRSEVAALQGAAQRGFVTTQLNFCKGRWEFRFSKYSTSQQK